MHRYLQFALTGLTAAAVFTACENSTTKPSGPSITDPSFTVATGFVSTPVARGNAGAFHIRSTDGFVVEIKAKDNTDIAVSNVVVAPGGSSGWHSHPGPVLVIVKTGTITFYRTGKHGDDENGENEHGDNGANAPRCTRTVYPAGSAFVEVPAPGHVMLAKNEGSIEATVTATYFAPPGAALRIDRPWPGGDCPQ
ncbi:MAG TPA: hypothetical protein VKB91_11570 [Gemmatimonadaceae bacterium]|nr:hypothetical protein [Gemmatimonadaceae bacterium]